ASRRDSTPPGATGVLAVSDLAPDLGAALHRLGAAAVRRDGRRPPPASRAPPLEAGNPGVRARASARLAGGRRSLPRLPGGRRAVRGLRRSYGRCAGRG